MSTISVDTISSQELRHLLATDPGVRVLDVRTGAEFETSHIPGSYNVPLDTLGEHASLLAQVDQPVVLVCQSGGRATKAHDALRAAGKQGLRILEGGLGAWEAAGGYVVRGDVARWPMDRQVRLVAGSLVLGAILVSAVVPKAKWLAAGVGGGLAFSAISNTCAMAAVLAKLPYNQTEACDIEGVLEEMRKAA